MADGSPNDSAPPAGDEANTSESSNSDSDEQAPQTVEEVEAIWKNRVSQKDKAHAAEAKALREQVASYEKRLSAKAEADSADESETGQWKAKYEEAQKAADQERQARLIEVREAKYPLAAEALEPEILAQMDEGKLAALNARLDSEEAPATGTRIDPNAAPRRSPSPPTSTRDKSVAELEADLKQHGPAYVASIHGE